MLTTTHRQAGRAVSAGVMLRAVVVLLALVTAAIHLSLGGFLFTLNAVGYAGLAAAMVLPGPAARLRWLVRLGLLAFTTATILGWVLFGARFPLAYVDKAVEVVLVAFLLAELWLIDGGPAGIIRRARTTAASVVALAGARNR